MGSKILIISQIIIVTLTPWIIIPAIAIKKGEVKFNGDFE